MTDKADKTDNSVSLENRLEWDFEDIDKRSWGPGEWLSLNSSQVILVFVIGALPLLPCYAGSGRARITINKKQRLLGYGNAVHGPGPGRSGWHWHANGIKLWMILLAALALWVLLTVVCVHALT